MSDNTFLNIWWFGRFHAFDGVKFIWVLVCGVGAFVLAAESAALLTLWRRPSRMRTLGLVSLGVASLMFWVMNGPFTSPYGASAYVYDSLRIVDLCYFNGGTCMNSVASQHNAAVVIALLLLLVVGISSACVVGAFKLKAREPRPPLGTVWLALVRLLFGFIGALVCAYGGGFVVTGLFTGIDSWVNYPLYSAVEGETAYYHFLYTNVLLIAGAIPTAVGALVLWLAGLRRRATMSTQST